MSHEKFLTELAADLNYEIHGDFAHAAVEGILSRVRSYLDANSQHWNAAAHLPTPDIPLKVMFDDGTVVDGIRPGYISDRGNDDLGYWDADGKVLVNVIKWTIK